MSFKILKKLFNTKKVSSKHIGKSLANFVIEEIERILTKKLNNHAITKEVRDDILLALLSSSLFSFILVTRTNDITMNPKAIDDIYHHFSSFLIEKYNFSYNLEELNKKANKLMNVYKKNSHKQSTKSFLDIAKELHNTKNRQLPLNILELYSNFILKNITLTQDCLIESSLKHPIIN